MEGNNSKFNLSKTKMSTFHERIPVILSCIITLRKPNNEIMQNWLKIQMLF